MLQFSIEPGRLLYCVRNGILHPYASELHGFWASWERRHPACRFLSAL